MDLRSRIEDLARQLGSARARGAWAGAPPKGAWSQHDWEDLIGLFTRDVTGKGFREFHDETRETYRFFVSELDVTELRTHPWYKRYPLVAWRVFRAMAYRLSPARRILFAIGVPLLAVGWLREALLGAWGLGVSSTWVLTGSTLLFVLLLMELRDKLALKGDLEVARQIQFGLLPFEPYLGDGVEVQASMRPANTVGGDYFDIVELGAGRVGIVVGDVAGKGMPAALLMALLQSSLRTLVTAGLRGSVLIEALNAHLHAHLPRNRLVTLFYGEIDPGLGQFDYVNAGHNPPFLLRTNGDVERLPATAVALGVLPTQDLAPTQTHFGTGDRLLLYTDGITEAFDPSDTEYGEDRLSRFLATNRDLPRQVLMDRLLADVLGFSRSSRPRDDMTLMMVEGVPQKTAPPAPASPPEARPA
jgi:serine phosphatase RsbU (regulator of sigma subunit)